MGNTKHSTPAPPHPHLQSGKWIPLKIGVFMGRKTIILRAYIIIIVTLLAVCVALRILEIFSFNFANWHFRFTKMKMHLCLNAYVLNVA